MQHATHIIVRNTNKFTRDSNKIMDLFAQIDVENTKNIFIMGIAITFILLFIYHMMSGDSFDAEEYIAGLKEDYAGLGTEGYTSQHNKERIMDYSCNDGSGIEYESLDTDSDNKNCDAGELNTTEPLFRINEENNVFKYHHLNDKVFTLKIEPGRYTGKKLAEALQNILNDADPEWWVTWDPRAHKFSLGANDFKYSRYLHKNSIYKTMGLKSPELFGLTAGTTEWAESETGSSLKIHA